MSKVSEKVAKRYARAFFELCDQTKLDSCHAQLKKFEDVWTFSPELRASVTNPSFPIRERAEALLAVARKSGVEDQMALNLVRTLLEQGRMSALPSVVQQFFGMIQHLRKALSFEVRSAFDVPEGEKSLFSERCKKEFGPFASISWNKDPSLLGGLVIKADDKVLDRSVRGALSKMGEELASRDR